MADSSRTLIVEEDKETGDLYIAIPPDLLKDLGWNEGDTITWEQLCRNQFSLTKLE